MRREHYYAHFINEETEAQGQVSLAQGHIHTNCCSLDSNPGRSGWFQTPILNFLRRQEAQFTCLCQMPRTWQVSNKEMLIRV